MTDEIEKIMREFDTRYSIVTRTARVEQLFGSHGKLIEDIRQWVETKLETVAKNKKVRV